MVASVRLLPRSRRRRLALLVTAPLFVLGLSEVVLRARGYTTRVAVWYDPSIGFRALPDQERWMLAGGGQRVARVSINSLGLRGPIPPLERTSGVPRVVTLGDSYTFGVGVEDDETYPVRLRVALAAELGAAEVLNVSFPSWNVRNALRAYRALVRPYRPDAVVFGFTGDDMAPTNPGVNYTDNAFFHLVGKTALGQALLARGLARLPGYHVEEAPQRAELHSEWRQHPNRIQRSPADQRYRVLWDEAQAALNQLAEEVRADGAELLVLFFPRPDQVAALRETGDAARLPERTLEVQRFLQARADAAGLEYLDMLEPLARAQGEPMGAIAKGHPSAAGYAAIASAASQALLPKLRRLPR